VERAITSAGERSVRAGDAAPPMNRLFFNHDDAFARWQMLILMLAKWSKPARISSSVGADCNK
jgi:hypothetical protein